MIKKILLTLLVVVVLCIGVTSPVLANDNSIEVIVSPNVLNLNSNGGSLSIHTDIDYSSVDSVDDVSLKVNEKVITDIWIFSDDRGDLVVKGDIETVKGMVSIGEATFELSVNTNANIEYNGSDTIRVISCGK
ncbi:hypothetical protein ACFLUX_00415 [Chloroflexota bacterium]